MTDTTPRIDLDVRPLAGHIGAEIHGVDIAEPLDAASIAEIRATWLRYKVVFFRDQHLNHASHIAFARQFGRVTPSHPYLVGAPEGYPEVHALDSRVRKRTQNFGETQSKVTYDHGWHSDVTPLINPPAASILRGDIVPPYGGDTGFTNLVAAYEGLPRPLQRLADSLRARHSYANDVQFFGSDSPFGQRITANPLVANHPLVRVHPETGERALYVSPTFTAGDHTILGLGQKHSQHILELFWEHIARPEYTARFHWETGSVAFWDNRATCHLPPGDLTHLDFDRVMYRVTLEGDVPVGPDGRESELVSGEPFLGS